MSRFMDGFNEVFGETLWQRVFWISLWVVSLSVMIFGVWLFGEMIDLAVQELR